MHTLTWFSPESSLLRFGACSVLLHIGALAMLGALPGTRPMDTPRPLVTVTLLEPPAPVPKDMPPEEAPTEAPPMLHAQRQTSPVAPHPARPSSPHQLRLPPPYPTQTTDIPPPPMHHAVLPVTRAFLSDQRAADALKAVPLETPPMFHTQRQTPPVASHQNRPSPSPHQLHLPPRYLTHTTDLPLSPTHHPAQTGTRALLSDQRATDALKAVPIETPPMLHAQRRAPSVASHQNRPSLSQPKLHLPLQYPTQATDIPSSPTRHPALPVTRTLLADQQAADALKAVSLETPPMLHAQRSVPPVASHKARPSPPHQLRRPPSSPTRATGIPPFPTRHAASPVTRALLADRRASDTLKLKNFTKWPARRPTPATHAMAVPQEEQHLVIAKLNTTNVWPLHEVMTPSSPTIHTNARDARKMFRDATADQKGLRTAARPIKKDQPLYPSIARERGWEGTVMFLLDITSKGSVERATMLDSSGFPVLDESAHRAVQAWKFEPAKDGEFAIPGVVVAPVKFMLQVVENP